MIEILADTPIGEAVKILSESNILSAPVKDPEAANSSDWRRRYLGIIDYSAIILWVLEGAELAHKALLVGTATAAGVGAGAAGAMGALALGVTGPAAIAGLTAAAAGAALAGGIAADRVVAKDAPQAADNLGEDFYKIILEEEPFKSTTVSMIMPEILELHILGFYAYVSIFSLGIDWLGRNIFKLGYLTNRGGQCQQS